jgi:pimeloyl-ACP methyl ester carboxylesterase
MNTFNTYKEISIKINGESLKGYLRLSKLNKGIILFAHGSGSSRLSIRNNYLASLLQKQGFSSLLFDLLTFNESKNYENRFNIELLTKRLIIATGWVQNFFETNHLPVAFFGSSTGVASALDAAVLLGNSIKAVISRGGRTDLSLKDLSNLKSPTLLIIGGNDVPILSINKISKSKINGICELKIIEGASHLFVEKGKLEEVGKLAGEWFETYLK